MGAARQRLFGATKTWEHLGEVQSEVVRFAVRFPSDKEQSSLLIDADAPVYDFVRLRLLNGEPVSLDLTVMPVGLVPGLTKSHLEGSVFRYVQETLGLKLMGSYRVVRAMKPGELDKQHLHCEPTDPVLEVEQVIYLEDGTPLEYAHCHYRYDHGGIILVNNG
ncbi:putative transcriptional regulator [Klebsiella pneumoniae]|uniref:Putative transcriptional regulator n=1 Tax=Klebsiella pneumoniae TaxID=573 RepID=A0A4P0Y1X3_KLEPN|nr:putative transcriptional regulator [Klebsiella pneumoniae]